MKLYEITHALKVLEDKLEDQEELNQYLSSVKLQLTKKVENVVKFQRNLEANANAIDEEIKRLTALRRSYQSNSDRLKTYLAIELAKVKDEKIDTPIAKLSFRKSEQVEVNEKVLEEKYWVVTKRPDKVKIKKDIKAGQKVTGAEIKEYKNLQIK